MTLVRIEAPHFCAGFVHDPKREHPRQVAPILWYMRDWPLSRVSDYCRKKGWRLSTVPIEDEA